MEGSLIAGIVATVMSIVGSCWYSVVTHEWSHYFAGRAAGVPSNDIRVRMRPHPPHVALRNNGRWLSPSDTDYVDTFIRHQQKVGWAWFFIAAGSVGEMVLVLGATAILLAVGWNVMAIFLVVTSTVLVVIYLIGDAIMTRRSENPAGDFSGMWHISRSGTAATVCVTLLIRLLALFIVVSLV